MVWGCGGDQRNLEVDGLSVDVGDLHPGKEYQFSVVTLSNDGSQSTCVSNSVHIGIMQTYVFMESVLSHTICA